MSSPQRSRTRAVALVIVLMAAAGAAGWFAQRQLGGGAGDRAAVEAIVRAYILEHPEILPEAMENLQRRQNKGQLAAVRTVVEQPYPGAVLGNPRGTVTLVEFTDYACGYCRKSAADVEKLIGAHPELRVVLRELPIISPHSAAAARMALAAAEQGKYPQFHAAMFAAGQLDPAAIDGAARTAGLDLERARKVAASDAVAQELRRNLELAQTLGVGGTPSWVVGEEIIPGAVGADRLAEAIAAAKPG